MLTIPATHLQYELDAKATPVATIRSGESVTFETLDCYGNALLPEGATFADYDRRFGNPATGPVAVQGAMPGDTLKITIEKLQVGPVGILDIGTTSGALAEYFKGPSVIKRLHVQNGVIRYSDTVSLPAHPMIGVIGVAPEGEPVSTKAPKDHGGNMDCSRIEQGSTLYLPVFAEGALLSMGDLHAIMGDGEVANCGLEIEGRVTVKCEVLKNTGIRFPMLENDTQWITIAYGDTLDEACDKAVRQMFAFLQQKQGLGPVDAGMLLDLAGDLIVCQIVNPYKTARVEIPKSLLQSMQAQG